jgi:tetratricopeptide (TPR) repeat protein
MREGLIGRVIVASLHQGIADVQPARLAFYENWLTVQRLHGGTIGMGSLFAVLSFLRLEGEAYQVITARAGEYAAEWTVQAMPSSHRAFIRSMPEKLRRRLVLRLARRIVRSSHPDSHAITRLSRETADVEVTASIFCTVREPVPHPLCGFYAAALTRLFRLFELTGRAEVVRCRGTGESICALKVALGDDRHVAGVPHDAADVSMKASLTHADSGVQPAPPTQSNTAWSVWRDRGLRGSLVAMVTIGAALAGRPAPARAQSPEPLRTLVMPFDVERDASIFWLGEAAAVLLTDDLNAIGDVAITRDERREAFERLQVPPTATLTNATAIRIGQLVGATDVITGSLHLEGGTLVVHARGLALETGRISHDVFERGPVSELFATFERAARSFAPAANPIGAAAQPQPSLPAFESYIKGLLAETPANAVAYLNASLTALPAFDRARLALWDVFAEQGDHARALAAVTPVPPDSPWVRRARFLAGLSLLNLNRNDEAFAAFKALADAQATAATLNNIGIAQIRRGAAPQAGSPAYYFNRAADLDPNDPDYCFNLGYAYWLARDMPSAVYWLREAVRRNPADGEAHFILGTALGAGGSTVEASRERDLARRLSSVYEQWEKRPAAEIVPKGLERVKGGVDLPRARQIETAIATSGQRDQRELAQFYLDRGRRLFQQEKDREAADQLNRAIFLSPYQADAHLLVGRIHLRNHRVREAIDAFKISLWSAETAPAHVALAEAYLRNKDADAARLEAGRALALDPSSAEAAELLGRINPP